ncbi:hypothetical protein [Parabacteroides sp. AM08-6]|uniref:hypothetical protein n=1 Tax=Parabacteroides sp. AM08-6 TaxID=2292053 RepID=UPI000EFF7FC1|nr:hypothetical protein [Parabacteroides sp. AM08-6]RHJ78007.1 hypothetical protein DW103_15630 [Parabacteroides sp. AM08-6]
MKRLAAPLLILLTMAFNLLSCNELDENYSTNPNHRLSFSADTLSFDTVFTTIGSATKEFMIYNQNNQPLLISEIMLASGEATGFRINVDGRKGDYFQDIRIQAKDSLYVFVEVTVNPNQENQPLLVDDSVLFTTNGIKQSVRLEAYGQNVHLYKGGLVLEKDTHFAADLPYLIYDSLTIAKGTTLDIAPGAILYMHDKAKIINDGTIVAKGTREKSIQFRGDRLDFILNDILPYDRTPGQWGGIFFRAESFDNVMDNVIIKNGTNGLTFEESSPEQSKLKINNSQITNMSQNLFFALNCNIEVINTELSNAGGSVVMLIGGEYNFIHCTLANYITLAKRTLPCLTLSNNANNINYPMNATFENCMIDGSFASGKKEEKYKGEMNLSISDGTTFDYIFNHCVIKSKGDNNTQFTNVIFTDVSPSYRLKGGEKNKYEFDFRPDSLTSLGVGKADLFVTQKYPIDRYGINRLTNDGPDIGAYEFVPKEDEEKNN